MVVIAVQVQINQLTGKNIARYIEVLPYMSLKGNYKGLNLEISPETFPLVHISSFSWFLENFIIFPYIFFFSFRNANAKQPRIEQKKPLMKKF